MAITTTILRQTVWGDMRIVFGKSVFSGSSAQETVATGLAELEYFKAIAKASSTAYYHSVTNDFPLASGNIVLNNNANDLTVYWTAGGK